MRLAASRKPRMAAVPRSGRARALGEPGLPLEWSETRNVVWKTPIRGRGWSSPVISNGRVWVTTSVADARGASLRALALDVESGRELVNVEVFRLVERQSQEREEQPRIPDADHRRRSRVRALRRRRDRGVGRHVRRDVWAKKFPYASQHGSRRLCQRSTAIC